MFWEIWGRFGGVGGILGCVNWCWGGGVVVWKVVMEAFLWCWGILMCVLGALGGIGGCLEGGAGAFEGDGFVLNDV